MCQQINFLLREWREGVCRPVFFSAATFNVGLIVFAGLWPDTAGKIFTVILEEITKVFGGYYVLATAGFLIFTLWLICSHYGSIRLGQRGDRPRFSRLSWLAMLFAAGMGMGLVFWGVAEPLYHYHDPPTASPHSSAAVDEAIQFSFFHWGLHPWAIYVNFGLGIALLHFRRGLPLAPRTLLFPLFGQRIFGWLGHITDAFCTVGTLLGVATSLGLGAMQINAGLSRLAGIAYLADIQIFIILLITVIATTSTVSGVSRGIKYLSVFNIVFMVVFWVVVFLTGPTLFQLKVLFSGVGNYLLTLVQTSFWIDFRSDSQWQSTWTLFYWGWWIWWSPFVGIFIARISQGRTVREFILCILFIPTFVNCLWFAIFGGTSLHVELFRGGGLIEPVTQNIAMSLHLLLDHLPYTEVMQWCGLLLVVTFFITSSDSGSFVDDMVTSGGNPNPPLANRVFWGISEGAAAAVLLLAGGLKALQAASISAGLPQSLLLILGCIGLAKTLHEESLKDP